MDESREKVDDAYWLLEKESSLLITATLSSLSQLKLERSLQSKAVREMSQAINIILRAYRKGSIDFESAQSTLSNLKYGFVDGVRAIKTADRNRVIRKQQRITTNLNSDSSYRRSMRVNNQAFNVRFKARCATPECLMRGANFDLQDDAFQDYVEAATNGKKDDVMGIVNTALIANPYARPLIWLANADTAYTIMHERNYTPLAAYSLGKGVAYRLKIIGVPAPIRDRLENTISHTTGKFLDENLSKN
ncbi:MULTISPECIES: hypothetical protein [Vibrio]|uniref:Uncharacterized protein n=1 Tax=Vibrio qingdaonensis TaxID=2829491 RepID=A0A9X3HZW0_9VIBR|nr:hypothetical protein [Vibrio qingdaonensis]MCW8349237.1 hypothetical protein [Vibrio qingdaonensis]